MRALFLNILPKCSLSGKISSCIDNNIKTTLEKKDIELIKILVNKLDSERASDWDTWLKLGFMLYNFNKSKEIFNIWENFILHR